LAGGFRDVQNCEDDRGFVSYLSRRWLLTALRVGPFLAAHLESPQDIPPSQGADTLSMKKAIDEAMRKVENLKGGSN
jgi:arylsulfatase